MSWRSGLIWMMMIGASLLLSADFALAQTYSPAGGIGAYGGGTIANLLCNVAFWFTGFVGQGIATLSVIVLGIGALFGKVSQGMAITTMVGIAVIFGAPQIVTELTGRAACYGAYF